MRHCADIGIFAIDRSREVSCVHRTAFCNRHCYNVKLERTFKGIAPADIRNDIEWDAMDRDSFSNYLSSRKLPVDRFRWLTRGEAFASLADIEKVRECVTATPGTVHWIPTRAWHDATFRRVIEERIAPLPNVRLFASIDPSDSPESVADIASAWSTMFFGNDAAHPLEGYEGEADIVRCPKTWEHSTGHCAVCKGGCFDADKGRKHIWLASH